MRNQYIIYHALTGQQRVVARRLFRIGGGLLLGTFLTLAVAWLVAGWPYDGNGMVWFWRPADGYGLFAAVVLTLGLVCAPLVTYALRQFWVDYKVHKQTEGISGLYQCLNIFTFCLFVMAAVQLGRLLFVTTYVLPTQGWGAGQVWSHRPDVLIEDVAFTTDDKVLLARMQNRTVHAWSRRNGRELNAAQQERFPSANPSWSRTSNNYSLPIGDQEFVRGIGPHVVVGNVGTLNFDPARVFLSEDSLVVAVTDQGILQVFQGDTQNELYSQPSGHKSDVTCLALSSNGRYLVTGGKEGTAILWELDAKSLRRLQVFAGGNAIRYAAVTNDAGLVATVPDLGDYMYEGQLHVWDVGTGRERLRFPFETTSRSTFQRLIFSSDGRFLLSNTEYKLLLYRIPEE
jgi:hypothetical protein